MANNKNKNILMRFNNGDNQVILWNPENKNVVSIPTTKFLKELQPANNECDINLCTTASTSNVACSVWKKEDKLENFQAASWKDDYAVKKLIHLWKTNQSQFKSPKIRNDVVWRQIAKELQNSNPNWLYTGTQCENKFKDIRKNYVKVKDHNANSTGGERKTCKFYEEMEEVFGDKPCIKPIAIASTLHKRSANDSALEFASLTLCNEDELKEEPVPSLKKSRIEKNLQYWAMSMRKDSEKKEVEKERRHKEKLEKQEKAIAAYQEMMTKLLDKL